MPMATTQRVHSPIYTPFVGGAEATLPGQVGTLDGKRLAVLENGWPTWRRMLQQFVGGLRERYPGLEVTEYAIPRGYAASEDLLAKIAAESDCAVVGLANCGSCTAWSLHDSVELQKAGLPTVWVVSDEFVGLGTAIMKSRNSPVPSVTLPVNPEMVSEREALELMQDYGGSILAELVDGSLPDMEAIPNDVGPRHIELPPDADLAFDELYERGMTDGLPVVMPTEERVSRMLEASGVDDPLEVVGQLPPRYGAATYENIAVSAVMAGCRPEYMPVLVAQVRAGVRPEFNLNGIATTTASSAPLTIVNGPIRETIGLNSGRGLLGPGWQANATIGRAFRLLMINVGGAAPGSVSKSVMGTPGRYTFCIAENEEASPWEPLHVSRGMSERSSAVTMMGILSTINCTTVWGAHWRDHLATLGDALAFLGSNNVLMGRGTVLVILTPGQATLFDRAGLSKADVAEGVWEAARIPIDRFPATVRPQPPNVWIEDDGYVRVVKSPDSVLVLVAGGPEAHYAHVMPSHPSVVPVSEAI
jgi:hypothetical protein